MRSRIPLSPERRGLEVAAESLGLSIDLPHKAITHMGIGDPDPTVLATFSRGRREERTALVC